MIIVNIKIYFTLLTDSLTMEQSGSIHFYILATLKA